MEAGILFGGGMIISATLLTCYISGDVLDIERGNFWPVYGESKLSTACSMKFLTWLSVLKTGQFSLYAVEQERNGVRLSMFWKRELDVSNEIQS